MQLRKESLFTVYCLLFTKKVYPQKLSMTQVTIKYLKKSIVHDTASTTLH